MRRRRTSIGKWVSTFLAIVLLAVMVAGKWWQGYVLAPLPGGGLVGGGTGAGVVHVQVFAPKEGPRRRCGLSAADEWWWVWRDIPHFGGHEFCGFCYERMPGGSAVAGMTMLYPVLAATAAAGLLWRADLKARRRERALAHMCASCGYDRAGLAGDVKCPECGAAPKA